MQSRQPGSICPTNQANIAYLPKASPRRFASTDCALGIDLGLPILARFRLIIDYSHGRLYAIPYADVRKAPFAKDRLGLSLNKEDAGFTVAFVAPNSPAQAAGFKVGDDVTLIDGKPAKVWPEKSFAALSYGASGTNLIFTMHGGGVRQVKLADYF
jgi:S1-C subfamily serine protease